MEVKKISICNVPNNYKEMESFSILIYFNDSNKTAVKKKQKEMFPKKSVFKKGYKTFHLNTRSLSVINERLNWKLNTSGLYDSDTKLLIKNDIDFFKLGLLLFPEEIENLLNDFFIEKFEIPIKKEKKLGIINRLKKII